MSTLEPRIEAIRKEYGLSKDDFWQIPQNRQWVCKHSALEIVAVKAKIAFDLPMVIEKDAASLVTSMVVMGRMGDRVEWATGETNPTNYSVRGKQPSYPWAMSEKRAKDRVTLKLVGIHGLVYSEEESDDFKASDTPNTVTGPAVKSSAALKRAGSWEELQADLHRDFGDCKSLVTLSKLRADYRERAKTEGWTKAWLEALRNEFDQYEDSLQREPPEDDEQTAAIRQEINKHFINAG